MTAYSHWPLYKQGQLRHKHVETDTRPSNQLNERWMEFTIHSHTNIISVEWNYQYIKISNGLKVLMY